MQWLRSILDRLQWFKDDPRGLAAVLLVNVGGIAYGFYYYLEQFRLTPPYLWIFVPDSPWAVLWAQLALVAYAMKRRSDVLDALAFVGNVQVGLWTAYVLIVYRESFGTFDFTNGVDLNFVLLWLHLGMVALAFLFVRDLAASVAGNARKLWTAVGAAAGVYLVNDALDYFAFRDAGFYGEGWTCGIRPITVPCIPGMEEVLAAFTITLTLVSAAFLAFLLVRVAPEKVKHVPVTPAARA